MNKKYELNINNKRNDAAGNNEEYLMPYEDACSAEFTKGCIIRYNMVEQ